MDGTKAGPRRGVRWLAFWRKRYRLVIPAYAAWSLIYYVADGDRLALEGSLIAADAVISGGSTSSRDDMNWPTLIMRPPRSTASTWNCCAMRCRRADLRRAATRVSPTRGSTSSYHHVCTR